MRDRGRRAWVVTALAAAVLAIAVPPAAAAPLSVGHSGWDWSNPVPQGSTLGAVDFFGPVGYAVGEFGTVLGSDDGGSTWTGLVSGLTEDLTRAQVIDSDSVVVAGECAVSRSDDGGATFRRLPWNRSDPDCRSPVVGISFPTASTGFVLRGDGRLYRTDDGGESWNVSGAVPVPTSDHESGDATDIAFRDTQIGLATTGDGIYRTDDGGQTWSAVVNLPNGGFAGLELTGASSAYAVGRGANLLASSDNGRTWSTRPVAGTHSALTSIRCANPGLCLATTADEGHLLRSFGGTSFSALAAPAPGTLAADFSSPGRAVAVGRGGISAISDDRGLSWSRIDGGLAGSFTQLRGDLGSMAFAIGQQGALARTADGGQSWTRVTTPTSEDIADVSFANDLNGYVLDSSGALFRTDDGGTTWAGLGEGGANAAQAVLALDLDRVILVGARGIRRSVDRGETFRAVGRTTVKRSFLFGIDYAGGSLFAYGPTSLLVSRDGGKSWRRLSRPDHRPLAVVDFVDSNTGFALGKGGRVWRTRSRGRHWTELRAAGTDGGVDLAAVDPREVYIATNDLFFASGANRPDYVLHTLDGGKSWRPQLVSDSRNMSGVLATGTGSALLLADDNLFFTTTTGGERGRPSTLRIASRHRRLRRPGTVRVTGRLRPADGGERVVVSRALADPRKRKGSIDWDFKSAEVRPSGRFVTTWKTRETSVFVAQWTGDGRRMGAGSKLLKVTVRSRRHR